MTDKGRPHKVHSPRKFGPHAGKLDEAYHAYTCRTKAAEWYPVDSADSRRIWREADKLWDEYCIMLNDAYLDMQEVKRQAAECGCDVQEMLRRAEERDYRETVTDASIYEVT